MTEPARKRPAAPRSRAQTARWTILSLLVIAWAVVYTLWHPSTWTQDGPSMVPAVAPGDRFFTAVLEPRLGDLVVVLSAADGATILKRVVGVAGDTVEMRSGDLYRNGHRVTGPTRPGTGPGTVCARESLGAAHYDVLRQESAFVEDSTRQVHVPSGSVYVLGDQRDRSNDSRFFGPVRIDHVLGRVLYVWRNGNPAQPCP